MSGESLDSATINASGLVGDRRWAVYNLEAREIQGARNLPALLKLEARYVDEPHGQNHGSIRISFPNGETLETDKAIEDSRLSAFVGARVRLCPLEPASNLKHYARGNANEAELRKQMGVEPDEQLPDFSSLPVFALAGAAIFSTPPGHYFDIYPLHIVTTGALNYMRNLTQNGNFVVERFRPNIVIRTEKNDAVEEFSWCGYKAHIGAAQIKIEAETVRCSIPSREQINVPADKSITRDVAKLSHRHFGLYATVGRAGRITLGDAMFLRDDFLGRLQKDIDGVAREMRRSVWDFLTGAKTNVV